MQIGIINSVWFGSGYEGKAGLEKIRDIGYQNVDILADPLDLSDEEYRQLNSDVKEVGLPVPSVICVAMGLSDFNPPIRRFHIDRAKRHIDHGADLNAPLLVLALGEYIWQNEVIPPELQWHLAVEAVQELGEHAKDKGLDIAMEIEPFDLGLINTVNKLVKFLEDVDHPSVKANIDCSHMWLMSQDPSEILKLQGQIIHCHFSDCNGETHGDLPPGRGNTPLRLYLNALKDAEFDGVVSLELEYAPDPTQIVEWVEEAYRETSKLMEKADVLDSART